MNFDFESTQSREGDIAVVTGANSGVGFEVSIGLAQKGFKVIMACRNLNKANEAKSLILDQIPNADIEVIQLDLSNLESVHEFAKVYMSRYEKLNLLINNAGILVYSKTNNHAGVEIQFATNHLGHFVLTALLLNLMPDNSASRVISTSSIAHKKGQLFFDDINCENANKWDVAYSQSKLACLMFSDELNRRLQKAGKNILSVCSHPGATDSGLFENMPKIMYQAMKIFMGPFILHSNESAARPTLMAALGEEVQGGQYFGPQGFLEMKGHPGIAKRTDYSKDEEMSKKLWDLSEQLSACKFDVENIKTQSTN